MLRATRLIARGEGLARSLLARAPSASLDWDTRCRSRFEATDSTGRPLAVFLARGTVVRGGDALVVEDGSLVRVIAAEQPVMVVRAASALELLRAAYHLGNRHVALEVQADRLQLEPDHVLAGMLRRMRLEVSETLAPFEPEAGAYGASHSHEHGAGPPQAVRGPLGGPVAVPGDRGADDDHGHDHAH
jgi:urease accessory protein